MPYLGNVPAEAYSQMSYQDLTGGSGTSFTLDYPVGNENEIEVFVNNVRQEPTVAYTTAGTALTMTGTITATDDFYVVFQGKAQQTINPGTNSIITSMIQSSAVTDAKIAGMAASKLTGALPAIDGSALTNLPHGMVKIYDAALSTGVSFQQLDNLFTDTYDNYHMNLSVSLAADGYFYFRFTDSSDSEIGSGSGEYGYANMEIDSASTFSGNTSSAAYPIRNGVTVTGGAGNESVAISADIIGVRQSTTPASIHGHATNFNANGTHEAYTFVVGLRPDYFQVVNGLTLTASQNFDGGRISIFGYKTS